MAEAEFSDHPEEMEVCKYCDQHFKNESLLREHIGNAHSIEDDSYISENESKKKPRITSDSERKEIEESTFEGQSLDNECSVTPGADKQDDDNDKSDADMDSSTKKLVHDKLEKLKLVLKENFDRYLRQLRLYFTGNITKEEFDNEVRRYFTFETIIAHNQFFLEFVQNIHSLAASTSSTSNPGHCNEINSQCSSEDASKTVDQNTENSKKDTLHSSNDKDVNKTQADNLSDSHAPKIGVIPLREYLPCDSPRYVGAGVRECARSQSCLPDLETMYALTFIAAWENDLQVIDKRAIPVLLEAVEIQVKRVLSAVLLRKSAQQFVNLADSRDCLNAEALKPKSCKSMSDKINGINSASGRDLICARDLLGALQVYPSCISLKSLHLLTVEKLLNKIAEDVGIDLLEN